MLKLFALMGLLIALPGGVTPSPAPASAVNQSPAPAPDALFSRRALRHARLLIQMRMLQFHEERLECVRAALLRQLPAALRPVEPTTWSASLMPNNACLLHF